MCSRRECPLVWRSPEAVRKRPPLLLTRPEPTSTETMAGIVAVGGGAAAHARVRPRARSREPARPSLARAPAVDPHRTPAVPAHQRRTTIVARASFGDPGYWDDVISLMTPSVSVNLGPESLAALAIGGVLVLGHSWESIEASRGWRSAKARKEKVESATATTAATSTLSPKKPRTTAAAKPMTKAEREAAVAEAKAERAAELNRRRADPPPPSLDECEIVVCTNNACAKRGAKELKAELERAVGAAAAEANVRATNADPDGDGGAPRRCVVKGARCMDACGAGCVVKVNGVAGLETHLHVDASEASVVAELATGRAVANVPL